MIITRTPFRVSFVGGGTDLKDFYSKHGYGAVISTAIKKYMYINIHPYFHDKIRIKYSKTEDVEHIDDIKHPIVRECLKKVRIDKGIEIASFADVPAGTGLGSSSAFTVGLLNALYAFKGQMVSKEQLAREACEIEIDILGEPIGKQDQYASAYGNMNYIKFNKDETVEVTSLLLSEENKKKIEQNLKLFYTGKTRSASDILLCQKKNIKNKEKYKFLINMLALVTKCKKLFIKNSLQNLGAILHENWEFKKGLTSRISNEIINNLYEKALNSSAKGGKLLGAGGGGFLLLYSEKQEFLKQQMNLKTISFEIDTEGTKILFYE